MTAIERIITPAENDNSATSVCSLSGCSPRAALSGLFHTLIPFQHIRPKHTIKPAIDPTFPICRIHIVVVYVLLKNTTDGHSP